MTLDSKHLGCILEVSQTTVDKWHKHGMPFEEVIAYGPDGRPRRHLAHSGEDVAVWLCERMDHANPPAWARGWIEFYGSKIGVTTTDDPRFLPFLCGYLCGFDHAGDQDWVDIERQKAISRELINIGLANWRAQTGASEQAAPDSPAMD